MNFGHCNRRLLESCVVLMVNHFLLCQMRSFRFDLVDQFLQQIGIILATYYFPVTSSQPFHGDPKKHFVLIKQFLHALVAENLCVSIVWIVLCFESVVVHLGFIDMKRCRIAVKKLQKNIQKIHF